jgi:hypothetical protein
MGSTSWNNKKGVQCSACGLWMDSSSDKSTPSHKPKGDFLAAKDCKGSGKKPKRTKGFEGKKSPYNDERSDRYRKGK